MSDTVNSVLKDHERRIKRKRGRVRSTSSSPHPPGSNDKVTSPQAWAIRYDYKLGFFAQARKDEPSALKYFSSAYTSLLSLLHQGSSSNLVPDSKPFLVPFTKRWSEAKLLLDDVHLRMVELQWNVGSPVTAYQQLLRHFNECKEFPEYSIESKQGSNNLKFLPVPNSGGSFEYWAWIARSFIAFAQVNERMVLRCQTVLPFPSAGSPLADANTGLFSITHEPGFGPFSGSIPILVVQHSGFYYLLGARCAEESWNRLVKVEQNLVTSPMIATTPLHHHLLKMMQESKSLDYGEWVVEILTKSYEWFKKEKSARMTLVVASDIARIYSSTDKMDLALKFYERIAKTYRKEKWSSVLAVVCQNMVECGRKMGDVKIVIQGFLELIQVSDSGNLERVQAEFYNTLASVDQVFVCDMDSISSFIDLTVGFKVSNSHIGVSQPFQVVLKTNQKSPFSPITFSKIVVRFSDPSFDHCILHSSETGTGLPKGGKVVIRLERQRRPIQGVIVNGETMWVASGPLILGPDNTIVFESQITPKTSQEVKIKSVCLVVMAKESDSNVVLEYKGDTVKRVWYQDHSDGRVIGLPLTLKDGTSLRYFFNNGRVDQRQLNVSIKMKCPSMNTMDEFVPISMTLYSSESEPVRVFAKLSVLVDGKHDPHTDIYTEKTLVLPMGKKDLIEAVTVDWKELTPKSETLKTIYLRCGAKSGTRSLTVSLYGYPVSSPLTINLLQTQQWDLSNPALFSKDTFEPLDVQFEPQFESQVHLTPVAIPAFLSRSEAGVLFESGSATRSYKWTLNAIISFTSETPVTVSQIDFHKSESLANNARIQFDSQTDPNVLLGTWSQGNVKSIVYDIFIDVDILSSAFKMDVGSFGIKWKSGTDEIWSWLDPIKVDVPAEYLRIYADIPMGIKVGVPVQVKYIVQNLTLHVAELTSYVDSSDHFVFSGPKVLHYRVLPLSTRILNFEYLAYVSGKCRLPNVRTMKKTDAAFASSLTDLTGEEGKMFVVGVSGCVLRGARQEIFVSI